MTKIDLTFAHNSVAGARDYREVDMAAPPARDHLELVGLYASIEALLPQERGMVVQFVSEAGREGCSAVARAAGWAAVELLGKRVLLIDDDAMPEPPRSTGPCRAVPPPEARESLHAMGLSVPDRSTPEQAIAKVRGMELYLAPLRKGLMQTTPLAAVKGFAALLDGLRPVFDLILVVPPPMSADPFGRVFARHIDGTVIVVEAERTRGAEAAELVDQISAVGGAVLGSVLNRRRHHVPRWLRRWV